MAIKPKKSLKEKYSIDETVEQFFLTGEAPEGTEGHNLKLGRFFADTKIPEIWQEHTKRLLKKWRSDGIVGESWVERWLRHLKDPYQFYLDEKEKEE